MLLGAGGLQAMAAHELVISRSNDGMVCLAKQREVGDDFNSDHVRIKYHELVTIVAKNLQAPELNKRRVRVVLQTKGKNTVFQFIDDDTNELLLELDLDELYNILGENRKQSGLVLDRRG